MPQSIDEIEKNLKSITDRLDMLDPLVKGKKNLYFRCSHSGLLFPADYVSEWGRKYGIGLGHEVRSECLDSMYHIFPKVSEDLDSEEDVMHPVCSSCAQVDVIFTSRPAPKEYQPILAIHDRKVRLRGKLIRARQIKNPANRIQIALAKAKQDRIFIPEARNG